MAWINEKANREAKSSPRAKSVALKACTVDPVTGERRDETEKERRVRFRMRAFKPRKRRAAMAAVPMNVVRTTIVDHEVVQDPREFGPDQGVRVSRMDLTKGWPEKPAKPPVQKTEEPRPVVERVEDDLLKQLNQVRRALGMAEV